MNDLLDRLSATTPPDRAVLIGCLAIALVAALVHEVSRVTRHLVTLLHEGGHALVALASGRSLHGIRLHSDASGVSVSSGRPSGPGMIATLLAGYLTPPLVGMAGAFAVTAGWSNAYLWAVTLLCAAMLLQIRNVHGLWVVLISGVTIGLVTWFGTDVVRSALAATLASFLLIGGPLGMIDLWRARRRPGRARSDVDQLAAISVLPAAMWWSVMMVCAVAMVGLGALRLLR